MGGVFVCFDRGGSGPGSAGDQGWAAAVAMGADRPRQAATIRGEAHGGYRPGLLALREGSLLEEAVRALPELPEVLLTNATGLDHPLSCGLAVHLGARLGIPTAGVTHRPLIATGEWPPPRPGAVSPLRLGDEIAGYWLRTSAEARPLAVHAGWRISAETAVRIVRSLAGRYRTPAPLREARRLARTARAAAEIEESASPAPG